MSKNIGKIVCVLAITVFCIAGTFISAVDSQIKKYNNRSIEKSVGNKDESDVSQSFSSKNPQVPYPLNVGGPWWNNDWSFRKKIIIDHSMVDVDLSNFPILVSLPVDAELANYAQSDGDDIVFIDDSGDLLFHEIEYFDEISGKLVAWVNITKLSSIDDTTLFMYFGNPSCGNQENISDTWDNGFVGVWHLEETMGVKSYDSTANQLTGTIYGDVTLGQTGIAGYCYDFDASGSNKGSVKNDAGKTLPYSPYSTWTVEGWMNLEALDSTYGDLIACDGTGHGTENFPSQIWKKPDGMGYWGADGTGAYSSSTFPLGKTSWVYGANVCDGLDTFVFWNSTLEITDPDSLTIGGEWIMGDKDNGGEQTDGLFDEIRISNIARNASWVNTTYNSIGSPSTFFSLETLVTIAEEPLLFNPSPFNGETNVQLSPFLSIYIMDAQGDDFNVEFQTNASGEWITVSTYENVGNGSYYCYNTSFVDTYAKKYWWSVNATDFSGSGNWTNRTYSFTTEIDVTIITNEYPSTGDVNVNFNPTLQADVSDNQGDLVNWWIRTNASGFWNTLNNGVIPGGNSTISTPTINMDSFGETYWWSVNATDSSGSGMWTNKTFYFTTLEDKLNFATFADTHFGSEAETSWPQWDYIDKLCQDIMNVTPPCEFVVHLGDIIHTRTAHVNGVGLPGGQDPYKNVMKAAYLSHLNLAHYICAGNHDECNYRESSADPYMLTKTLVKETELNTYPYAMMRENILFLFVPELSYITWTHPVIYEWIEYMTSEYPNRTTIIFAHQAIEDTCRHGSGGPGGAYRGKQDMGYWSSLFRNNSQIKMWINGHNHQLDWYQGNQSSGLSHPVEYFGHEMVFSQPYSQTDFGNEHEEDRIVIYSIDSYGIYARSWENNGGTGYWVDEYNYTFNISTTYDVSAEDWYSFPIFLQDNETQLTDMKVLSENITLQLIGTRPMELFFDSTMAGRVGWANEVILSFDNDKTGDIERTDPGMKAHGPTTITFPPKHYSSAPWEDGKSAQPYHWFPMGCSPAAVPRATYEITMTAKSDNGTGRINLEMSCSDWETGTQHSTLAGSTSLVFSEVVGTSYETITGTYTVPDDENAWFLQGTLSFENSTDYDVSLFSIKRQRTSDFTENFSLCISGKWYNKSGILLENEKKEFLIGPVDLADDDGVINVTSSIMGNCYGMIRLIYHAPLLMSRNARYKVNDANNGIYNISLTDDISGFSNKFKMFPFTLDQSNLFISADDGSGEKHTSGNGNVWVTCNTPNPGSELFVEILYEADVPGVLDESPDDGADNVSLYPALTARIRDAQGDTVFWRIMSNSSGSWTEINSGTKGGGDFIISAVDGNMSSYATTYCWSVNVTDIDGSDRWTNKSFSFTTRLHNYPSVISAPMPINGSTNVPISLLELSFTITDSDGNLMNYTVTTTPDIGNGNGDQVPSGRYSVNVVGLSYSTVYHWSVNVTDGTLWTNKTYRFTTENPPAAWWNTSWLYRKQIIINHTKVSMNLTDFPALINITDTDVKMKAQSNAEDIVFTDYTGNKLNHETELYDNSTGLLLVWVNIPSLSSTEDTILYMYYGNPSCSNMENPLGVWDANYMMVQHLHETTGTHFDSTSNSNDGTTFNGVNQNVVGKVDGADSFDGINDYIRIPNDSSLQFGEGSFTAESWVRPNTGTNNVRIINNRGTGSGGSYKGWQFKIAQSGSKWKFKDASIDDAAGNYKAYESTSTYNYNEWYHVAMVYEADNELLLYVNGNLDGTLSVGSYGSITNNLPTAIGAAIAASGVEGTYDQFFDGSIDEIRLSDIPRDGDWLLTCYRNQGDPNGFYSLGREETYGNMTINIPLYTGWNLITIPVENNYTAISLSENITDCVMISRFDAENQTYRTYIVGGPPGFDFSIQDGYGYFALVNTNSMLFFSGNSNSGVSVDLELGWNMIGWYQNSHTTANSLGENITGCQMVSWFDPVSQSFKTFIVGGPAGFDFTITPGMGLFVLVDTASTWH